MTEYDPRDLARRLIDLGTPVFCAAPDPTGITKSGKATGYVLPGNWQDTIAHPRTLNTWRPGHALCAVGGQALDFIDVDPRNGGDTAFAALHAAGSWPREYARVNTPSGGFHSYIYRLGTAKSKRDGIDHQGGIPGQKADQGRGFVFMPGTVRVSKATGAPAPYVFLDAYDKLDTFGPDDNTGATFRTWIRSAPAADAAGGDVWDGIKLPHAERLHQPITTNRDGELAAYTASCMSRGMSKDETYALLDIRKTYVIGGDPAWPFDTTDYDRWWKGALKYAPTETADPDIAPVDLDDTASILEQWKPLDWHALWADETEDEWICEPLIAAGRGTVLYSPPKVGKSILTLEIAANLASGREALGFRSNRPIRTLILDHENDPRSDTRDRLMKMGFKPDDLDNLIVLSYPIMATLDTAEGGKQVLALATAHNCELVVIDTVSRAVAGEENDNFTWLSFYRHTGVVLKRAGIAMLRLDHTGKDTTKGQRGGSAKSSDVDLVWALSEVVKDETYQLDCTHNRMMVHEKTITIHRSQFPLGHHVDANGRRASWDAKVAELVKMLDKAGAPKDVGVLAAERIIKAAGGKPGARGDGTPLKTALARRLQAA